VGRNNTEKVSGALNTFVTYFEMKSLLCTYSKRGQYVSPSGKIGSERGGNFGQRRAALSVPGHNANSTDKSKPELSAV